MSLPLSQSKITAVVSNALFYISQESVQDIRLTKNKLNLMLILKLSKKLSKMETKEALVLLTNFS